MPRFRLRLGSFRLRLGGFRLHLFIVSVCTCYRIIAVGISISIIIGITIAVAPCVLWVHELFIRIIIAIS